jgi:hypothetical protein
MSGKVHVIKDENLGGVLREFVEVDRAANVGDKIVIVNPRRCQFGASYTQGTIMTVENVYEDGNVYCGKFDLIDKDEYQTIEPTSIVHIDGVRYRMVGRNAKVGERIIIIDADIAYYLADIAYYLSNYKNGDVFAVFDIDYDGRVTEVKPNVFDDKINVILPYEYCVLEPVHECDQCGKALGDNACTNSKGGSYCSAKCAKADEETSPTVHEMLANLSEQIVKLNRRIDRLADANEQAITTVARDVERVDADLIKLRKEFEESKDVKLTLSSELVAKLIEKGLSD